MAPTRSSKSQPSNLRSRNTQTTRKITQNTKDRQAVNTRAPKKRSNRHRVEDNSEDKKQENSSPQNKQKENNSNRLHPNIQDTISLLQQNYIKSKLMLALIGNVSEATVNKFLGEDKPFQQKSDWNRYVAFSLESANTQGWEERNVHLGEAWSSLLVEEKAVFSPPIFQFFSEIPCHHNLEEDEEDPVELTPEENDFY
ncbi:hypothetical protein PGTUg99_001846 [Puccinia graminis f. sp. tritici]|uniref:Uncharacterized protein n=1 Tax=Puccinia graminis f. sp. tritici TaxID=56615 RepID=A0A5B0S2X5_PUCGR|nr:hypothetical protein PGTUg99_002235 [Puccinia graminis f. sp. tritici]KAA1134493.1 hypothetical protein PGTUg99_001846 [Puccinia graminis f. sp. tritici]